MARVSMVKYGLLAAKMAISVGLVVWIATQMKIGDAFLQLSMISPTVVVAATAVIALQMFISVVRNSVTLTLTGSRLPVRQVGVNVLVGAFFSQTMISFVGGDAMRILGLTRRGLPIRTASAAILLDRTYGLIGLLLLVAVCMSALVKVITDPAIRSGITLALVMGFSLTAAFLMLGRLPQSFRDLPRFGVIADMASVSRYCFMRPGASLLILALSFVTNIFNVVVVWLVATDLGASVSFLSCLIVVPPVLFLSMLPISVSGWGVREGAMVVAFGYLGVASDEALATSLLFGLLVLAAGLPGGLLWLLEQHRYPPGGKSSGGAPPANTPAGDVADGVGIPVS
ncbi:hypothetical protein N826_07720 [Skermanella aerolata KACC 11604]|nr:hypothetical protein N826_07720 [Skermanella aerolata KACC 11604]